MFPGQYTLCLKTKDLAGMRRFYEALGMKMHFEQPNAVLLNNGDIDIALMTFLDETCLNFRGADVFQVHANAVAAGLKLESEPQAYKKEEYDAEADGASWVVHDPDGNNVFFDTNEGEIGAKGAALALQRVLDATAKQFVNVGAPQDCQDAFRSKILERFMPPVRRAKTAFNLDTSPLTEPGMFVGYFTYCLKTTDNVASRAFYQALGLQVAGNNDEKWVEIDTSDCHLDLMTFLGANWLNFRGADVFELYDRMKASGFELEGEPVRYTEEELRGSAPGAHWKTRDPDSNVVYFDTKDPELIVEGDSEALKRVLNRALRQLEEITADEACVTAFKTDVVDRYMT